MSIFVFWSSSTLKSSIPTRSLRQTHFLVIGLSIFGSFSQLNVGYCVRWNLGHFLVIKFFPLPAFNQILITSFRNNFLTIFWSFFGCVLEMRHFQLDFGLSSVEFGLAVALLRLLLETESQLIGRGGQAQP